MISIPKYTDECIPDVVGDSWWGWIGSGWGCLLVDEGQDVIGYDIVIVV